MSQRAVDLQVIIDRYRKQLLTLGIKAESILLYGSYASGNESEGSDIDLIVISSDWQRFSYRERLEMLGVAAARILCPVQAVGFTPLEIASGEILPFWQEIIDHASKAA